MTLCFQLPIETVAHSSLDETVLKDLEVLDTKTLPKLSNSEVTDSHNDTDENAQNEIPIADSLTSSSSSSSSSMFDVLYSPKHAVDSLNSTPLMSYYTTDVEFLKDTQRFHLLLRDQSLCRLQHDLLCKAYDCFNSIQTEDDFHSRYQYIEIGMFKSLNHSPHFMQMLSFYNMFSPLITLLTPIVILILPFFIIRFQGVSLSLTVYLDTIKSLLKNHALGRLASSFGNVSWDKRVYLLITVAFYVLQIYQNSLACYRFVTNMRHIHQQLFILRDYLSQSLDQLQSINQSCNHLNTYTQFVSNNAKAQTILTGLLADLNRITPLSVNVAKSMQIGNIMKTYYDLRYDTAITQALSYSFHFNSFIHQASTVIQLPGISKAHYTSKHSWKTKDIKYPHHIKQNPIGNSFELDKPIILTGPNASGKTTLLKAAFLNTLLSQQIGFGFFKQLTFQPYTHFHCYLDVPDTSGRDSLFQAEARRCLDIVQTMQISDSRTTRFFCVFDELYSGTNPTEAVASAYAFVKHLAKKRNCHFLLTTHFYDLCYTSDQKKIGIRNKQMGWTSIVSDDGSKTVAMTYKIKQGISSLRGGVRVLKELGYPESIVADATSILKEYV